MNTSAEFLKRNLGSLARRYPELARLLLSVPPAAADLIQTRAGVPSLRLKNAGGRPYTLHSTVDPLAEAERTVRMQLRPGSNSGLVYGFGLGYHVERLLEELPAGSPVLVIEPQISIFRLALESRDLTHLFENQELFWAVGEKDYEVARHFSRVFRVISLEGVSIISHNASVKLCGEYFNVVDDYCRKWLITVGGNFLTNVISVRTYMSNTLDNILAIVDNPPIIRLFGRFRKVPGIVISAGPSLDRHMGTLKLLEKHAVLICVDTALGPLYRSGVCPHLVLAGDPSENNLRHLQGVGRTGAALVAEPMTHPRIISEFDGRKFIMSFNEVLMKKLAGVLGDFGRVEAWGSISTGAFDLARKLGCDPIVFIGQDLAFTGGRYYAHGTYQEQRWLRELSWPEDLDDVHRWRMSKENDLDATDIYGRPLRTSRQLEAYRHYFEREISETEALVLNATEGGTGFSGVENVTLEAVLWRYARRERSVGRIIGRAGASRSEKEISHALDFLQSTGRELENVYELCNQGFELTRRLYQNESQEPEADYRQVESIYSRVYECAGVREILENANQGGILTYQRGVEKLKGNQLDRETIEKSAQLYGAFFISFFQTASLLKKKFGQAAISVGCRLSGHGEEKLLQAG